MRPDVKGAPAPRAGPAVPPSQSQPAWWAHGWTDWHSETDPPRGLGESASSEAGAATDPERGPHPHDVQWRGRSGWDQAGAVQPGVDADISVPPDLQEAPAPCAAPAVAPSQSEPASSADGFSNWDSETDPPCAVGESASSETGAAGDPEQPQVFLYTMGVKEIDCEVAPWQTCVLALDVFFDTLFRGGRPRSMYMDAREFHDPNYGKLKSHVGLHPEIMRRLTNHDGWADWFEEAKEGIAEAMADANGDPILVVIMCKSGRHRSVAAGEIIVYWLEYIQAHTVRVVHIGLWHFGNQHRTCRCEACLVDRLGMAARIEYDDELGRLRRTLGMAARIEYFV